METKYLRIFTFIFFKKIDLKKKRKRTKKATNRFENIHFHPREKYPIFRNSNSHFYKFKYLRIFENIHFHPREIEFKELKSCLVGSNQVGINPDIIIQNQKNRFGILSSARDRSIYSYRSVDLCKSTFADRVKWTRSISIYFAFFFVLNNDRDRSIHYNL